MKVVLLLAVYVVSLNVYASTSSNCKYGKFDLSIVTNQKDDVHLDIYNNKTKISGCVLKVVSYDDGKSGVSTDELTRFELVKCNVIYDKLASKINLIKKGFIKKSLSENITYAYIIKNEQPLKCKNN